MTASGSIADTAPLGPRLAAIPRSPYNTGGSFGVAPDFKPVGKRAVNEASDLKLKAQRHRLRFRRVSILPEGRHRSARHMPACGQLFCQSGQVLVSKDIMAGCPARIRTLIDGVRVRSLTIRGKGNISFIIRGHSKVPVGLQSRCIF